MPEIIWKVGAQNDLLSIMTELDEFSSAAVNRLYRSIESGLEQLKSLPNLAPIYERQSRRLVLGKTAYGLIYTVEARGIIIHTIAHLGQDPKALRERVRRLLDLR